jgi:predicted transcriptional regulator
MPRLTIEFPDKVNDILTELSEKDQTTKVDVLRRALALYDYIQKEVFQKEKQLSVRDKDGKVETNIVLR